MRRLVIVLLVLVAVLAVLDRVAVYVAQDQLAVRAERSEDLAGRPGIHIGGFPFLTQVVAGRYADVRATVHDLTLQGLRIDTLQVHLRGAHVPLSDLLHGDVRSVPVDRGTGFLVLTYADINSYLAARGVPGRVGAAGDTVKVTGTVTLLGQQFSLSGSGAVGVSDDAITVSPTAVSALAAALPSSLQSAAVDALRIRIPVTGLPFGVHLRSAAVTSTGLRFDATGSAVVLQAAAS